MNHIFWKRSGPENIHLDTGTPNSRRRSRRFSWRISRVSSTTSRLTSGTLEVNGKACQAEGEAKVVEWKLHLENARKLRGIYFIDPEDNEFEETIKNARKKLETSVAPAMPCKISKNNQNWETRGKSNQIKSKFKQDLGVFWKLMISKDCVWEIQYQIIMITILQEKETIHSSITIWYT